MLSCDALLSTLTKAQVATAVLTFGSQVALTKPFNQPAQKASIALRSVRQGGGTGDFAAVRYAHNLLLARQEQRKVGFVITDGLGNAMMTREQCLAGARSGITTIGIGIEHNVGHVYPNAIQINEPSDLGTVSFKQIKLAV